MVMVVVESAAVNLSPKVVCFLIGTYLLLCAIGILGTT